MSSLKRRRASSAEEGNERSSWAVKEEEDDDEDTALTMRDEMQLASEPTSNINKQASRSNHNPNHTTATSTPLFTNLATLPSNNTLQVYLPRTTSPAQRQILNTPPSLSTPSLAVSSRFRQILPAPSTHTPPSPSSLTAPVSRSSASQAIWHPLQAPIHRYSPPSAPTTTNSLSGICPPTPQGVIREATRSNRAAEATSIPSTNTHPLKKAFTAAQVASIPSVPIESPMAEATSSSVKNAKPVKRLRTAARSSTIMAASNVPALTPASAPAGPSLVSNVPVQRIVPAPQILWNPPPDVPRNHPTRTDFKKNILGHRRKDRAYTVLAPPRPPGYQGSWPQHIQEYFKHTNEPIRWSTHPFQGFVKSQKVIFPDVNRDESEDISMSWLRKQGPEMQEMAHRFFELYCDNVGWAKVQRYYVRTRAMMRQVQVTPQAQAAPPAQVTRQVAHAVHFARAVQAALATQNASAVQFRKMHEQSMAYSNPWSQNIAAYLANHEPFRIPDLMHARHLALGDQKSHYTPDIDLYNHKHYLREDIIWSINPEHKKATRWFSCLRATLQATGSPHWRTKEDRTFPQTYWSNGLEQMLLEMSLWEVKLWDYCMRIWGITPPELFGSIWPSVLQNNGVNLGTNLDREFAELLVVIICHTEWRGNIHYLRFVFKYAIALRERSGPGARGKPSFSELGVIENEVQGPQPQINYKFFKAMGSMAHGKGGRDNMILHDAKLVTNAWKYYATSGGVDGVMAIEYEEAAYTLSLFPEVPSDEVATQIVRAALNAKRSAILVAMKINVDRLRQEKGRTATGF